MDPQKTMAEKRTTNQFLKKAIFVAMLLVPTVVYGAGIRFGAPAPSLKPGQEQRIGGRPSAAQAGEELLDEAQKLRARYRQKKSEREGTAHEHQYGYIVAFFDTKSLLNPLLVDGLNRLEEMEGIKFLLFKSANTIDRPLEARPQGELKRLSKLEAPFARDDSGGVIADQYQVTKFPTVLYETPSHDVVKFYVPITLEKVFTRIGLEKRKLRSFVKEQ